LLLLFLLLLGAGLGWAFGDRTARQCVQQTEADNALSRAARCLEQGKYAEAAAWAERAEGALAGGEEHRALRPRLQAIRADLDMVAEWFFRAMAHQQLAHEAQARQWYKKAVEWMEKHSPEGGAAGALPHRSRRPAEDQGLTADR
jgi:Tfp pilus assembly protein PilF